MPLRLVYLRLLYVGLVLACVAHAQTILTHSQYPDSHGEQPNPAASQAPPFVSCPAGAPLGGMDVRVLIPGQKPLPFRTITHLTEGDTLEYSPILRPKEKRPGEVALILVPAKREPGGPEIFVTDPKPAGKTEQWKMDRTISLAALVYGPSGLNRKKVTGFLAKDEVVIAQLADYAAKTEQAEKLMETLSNKQSSPLSISAALSSFSSGYGFSVAPDESAPAQVQAGRVFSTMNTGNPLGTSTVASSAPSGGVVGMAASFFFADPVGVATGGMSALLELRAIAFPGTQFRASFIKPIKGSEVALCGQEGEIPAHTRIAYIWASRIPNAAAPVIHIGDANFIPENQKTPVPVKVDASGWKYLDRARDWALVDDHKTKTPVSVVDLGKDKALEIDLTKAHLAPGDYKLTGFWDWAPMEAIGTVHVRPLSDFKQAHLETASQDRLLAGSGKDAVTLTGGDFEFISKVEMKKLNDEFATESSVPFHLPKGLRKGPQDRMDVQIDTGDLSAAAYELLISQPGSKSHAVNFKVLPNPPHIDNLPIIVNQGAGAQHFVLKGQRLGLLAKLQAPGAAITLKPADSDDGERSVTVEMNSSPTPGTELAVKEFLDDRSEPLTLSDALEITGPLPLIASSKLSLPAGIAIAIRENEFPAGYTLNALLDVKNIERSSVLRLECADGVGEHASLALGERTAHWNLEQLSPDQLFLAFDTSGLPAGCALQAVVDNGRSGKSQPFPLARILPVPQVDSFTVSADLPVNGMRHYRLTGANLELIAKLGWDETNAVTISELPAPLPGPGLKQSIDVNLPDPASSGSNLYVWLRGDKQARATKTQAPPLSAPIAAPLSVREP